MSGFEKGYSPPLNALSSSKMEANTKPAAAEVQSDSQLPKSNSGSQSQGQKRKRGGKNSSHHGRENKSRDMGRGEYFRSNPDRRQRTEDYQAKRQRLEENGQSSHIPKPFSQEEIAADDRRPKRKVAVMLGYSGSGYKGMQIMPDQKTIEGDLFAAFVAAGAISKANADDPKKSSFVRCARTDKGVHAAGNVISLKLIIEDPDILQKINNNLPSQIRIFGFERTTNGFSCYQQCDSRWYEYLIPTHCFLPPHPKSWLGEKLVELAKEVDDADGYHSRQEEVANFWDTIDLTIIKPILDGLDEETRRAVEQALYKTRTESLEFEDVEDDEDTLVGDAEDDVKALVEETQHDDKPVMGSATIGNPPESQEDSAPATISGHTPLDLAIKSLKAAYINAKEAYRISPARLERVQDVFARYRGTNNFHNYTVRKSPSDPAAKRHIISFKVNPEPILIDDTEWLSLNVHGQSFMMHQIRKMVGLAALVVRCGTPPSRIDETLQNELYSIPKAPGLGLLLERPVFDNYNATAAQKFDKNKIDFAKYEKEIEEFKRREVYSRIFREEDRDHVFHSFFTHLDNFKETTFLYLSSKGNGAVGAQARTASNVKEPSRKDRKGFRRRNHGHENMNIKEEDVSGGVEKESGKTPENVSTV